ncbi:hypothetical protein [Flavobacterium stagni]|uniref:Lipoprotein n=1 Tax=Flavobacterium stagni TaxID=2506421 RepID=A0A4Q1KC43_9FLAO|nr:hypothetical protein [Flavobacterium stagni]RXR23497.1 hypothetical protein EQG61_05890 [Flavobacterium stagni]
MKPVFSLCCLILLFACSQKEAQPKPIATPTTTETDIYFAINLVFETLQEAEALEGNQTPYLADRLVLPSYCEENSHLKKKIDAYFPGDSVFLTAQCKQWRNLKLDPQQIQYKKLLSADELAKMRDAKATDRQAHFLDNYQKKYGKLLFYQVSIPVFAHDKKTFYIDVNTIGSGQSFLFTQKKGKWSGRVVSNWIS